ncbi:MAG: penicillin-insensitive murein endopeptidase [Myxococcales bacterium]|jgi:murein endopeptidase|nr:penicillin-insensitive murein endopeptidase [Myxococcales bacterium]
MPTALFAARRIAALAPVLAVSLGTLSMSSCAYFRPPLALEKRPVAASARASDAPPAPSSPEAREPMAASAALLPPNEPEPSVDVEQPQLDASARRDHLARITAQLADARALDELDGDRSDGDSADEGDEETGEFDDIEEPGGATCEAPSCGEGGEGMPGARPGVRYTTDIDDETLARLWKESPERLGSISIGLPSLGRLVNARPFPTSDYWRVTTPLSTYATQETIAYLTAAIAEVVQQFPDGHPLRVNHISAPNGGYLRPHQSHQSGRDVDLSFYYGAGGPDRGAWAAKHNLDMARNWALVRALITETDVQVILVDKSIIRRLYDHALAIGEDKAWLDSVFHVGANSLLRHARRHRDHFHVRFYNPRAQELGRRILPMMPKDPRENLRYHRVKKGDTLGKIAFAYGSTVKAIQQANNLKSTMIRLDQRLAVPMRGPCVNCPMPPEVIVPPRRLPPPKPAPLMASLDSMKAEL